METVEQTTICYAPDCDGRVLAKGLCSRHYKRMHKRGSLAQRGASVRKDRCEAIQEIRSEGGEVFYVRCDRDGTQERPHGGKHRTVLRVDHGWEWKVTWEGGL